MAIKSIKNGTRSISMLVGNAAYDPTVLVEYLVIAGGGAGSLYSGADAHTGGGGAGGYRCSVVGESSGGGASAETRFSASRGTTYTVTVGAGGAGVKNQEGNSGSNSVFGSITSIGGGGGGFYNTSGAVGGSGGGAGTYNTNRTGAAGTANQGYAGGNSLASVRSGGGGGAGGVGSTTGGSSLSSSITTTSVARAGGGGGESTSGGFAGGGGGATAGNVGNTSASATANTGSGSGGVYQYDVAPPAGNSGNGGSGVVILRFPDTYTAAASTTGSPTITTTGGYRIYTYTGSGSITF